MNARAKTLLLLTAILLWPAVASAQGTAGVEYVGNYGWNYGGYYVGPYRGLVSSAGSQAIDMYCVDSANWINTKNNPWTAYMTPLVDGATLENTYLYGTAYAYDRYWQAAYLTTKFWQVTSNMERGAIHAAIWSITTQSLPSGFTAPTGMYAGSYVATRDYNYWMGLARTDAGAYRAAHQNEWVVLSDVSATNPSQEFLVRRTDVVPEPETWALMFVGLVGVAGAGVLRGRVV